MYSLFVMAAMLPLAAAANAGGPAAAGVSAPAALSDTLAAANILADRGVTVSKSDTLSLQGITSTEELVYLLPSLGLSDYGGYAGLKSVSLRGLGSAHTAIYVDGVRVANVQSGQPDLGFLELGAMGSAVVDYAQNSIDFRTARPEYGSAAVNGSVGVKGGSFGTYMPSARLNWRLSDKLSASANFGGLWSGGAFPLAEGGVRQNNDMRRFSGSIDLFGRMHQGEYHLKAYANGSRRGTPGSSTWPSTDRQNDRNYFLQGSFGKTFGSLYTLNLSAKFAADNLGYISEWGDSDYRQRSYQLGSTHRFAISKALQASASVGASHETLESTYYSGRRTSVNTAVTAAVRLGRFSADLGLNYDICSDAGQQTRTALSPSAQLRFRLAEGLYLGGFARRAYRVPTFNELYYPGYGNAALKPEDAFLSSVGLQWERRIGQAYSISAGIDGFHYRLRDKIVSAPTEEDPNIWLPYNVGLARTNGAEAGFSLRHDGRWNWGLGLRYTFQDARDITPDSYSYGSILPYAAKHGVSASADVSCKGWSARADWTLRAGRYDSYGELPAWNALNISAGKTFAFGRSLACKIGAKVLNVFDKRYEAVRYYPLPGRSFLLSAEFSF